MCRIHKSLYLHKKWSIAFHRRKHDRTIRFLTFSQEACRWIVDRHQAAFDHFEYGYFGG